VAAKGGSPLAPVNRAETALFLRRFAPEVQLDTIYPPRPVGDGWGRPMLFRPPLGPVRCFRRPHRLCDPYTNLPRSIFCGAMTFAAMARCPRTGSIGAVVTTFSVNVGRVSPFHRGLAHLKASGFYDEMPHFRAFRDPPPLTVEP